MVAILAFVIASASCSNSNDSCESLYAFNTEAFPSRYDSIPLAQPDGYPLDNFPVKVVDGEVLLAIPALRDASPETAASSVAPTTEGSQEALTAAVR